ncbi:TetR/AcrR family transcriptional regulator [Mucilaginibacter terrenus]|uniref:TetR/AcrR family transcriptional regulator n=1 Tax=Mucilaginibacter terrenus TaxID=2482727 RepID=A0A3E2NKH6_9SPHI|nr:TetR/AcrR family transcriptional regulator [Mucilaginibacter terrenus]RFZ81443.1 TetR/AcrR family transcriptional regulator [Mucilaginibacter terrenus]
MEKEKIDKKDHILDAAERVFAESGYDGASTRVISKEAGVNMAMLNYYFGSKEGVFLAIFERRIASFRTMLTDISVDNTLDPWEKLDWYIDKYVDRVVNNNCFQVIINRELSKQKKTDLSDRITTIVMSNVVVFQDIILNGIKSGHFSEETDVQLLVSTLHGTKNYIVNTPHISSRIIGYDVTNAENQEILKPRLKSYMKRLLKCYLSKNNDNN